MTQEVAAQVKKFSRDEIRTGFFGTKIKTKEITLESGAKIEIRQPSVGGQINLAEIEQTRQRMIRMIIEHCYVPGTNEKVFDETDFDLILQAPAGGDYAKILDAVNDLMGVKAAVKEQAKN